MLQRTRAPLLQREPAGASRSRMASRLMARSGQGARTQRLQVNGLVVRADQTRRR